MISQLVYLKSQGYYLSSGVSYLAELRVHLRSVHI